MNEQDSTIESSVSESIRSLATWTCPTCNLSVPVTATICPQDGTPQDAQKQLEDVLSSNYEFLGTIGSGGMSVIYKAKQLLLDKPVAIKMLHSHLLSELSIMRFQQEAKAASSLKHPNVIAVHDFGISRLGQPYMVMDFIDGKTLAEVIKERGALPLPEAMDIFIAVSSALEHAHQHNLLHRDLKPSNIMLRSKEDGYDVFLVDFGIAKVIDTEAGGVAQQLTQSGEVMGSPLYMSPEQCMGKRLDQRSDIYSLGCILYEAVAGVPPHRGDTMIETIFKHLHEEADPLHVVRPDINFPEAFEELVASLLATQANDRIQTISEVKERLEAIQAGSLQRTLPTPKSAQQNKFSVSKSTILATIGVLLTTAGLIALIKAENTLQAADKLKTEAESEIAKAPPRNERKMQPVAPIAKPTAANIKDDPSYENLKGLGPECHSLNLSESKVTDGALLALTYLPNLERLDLSHTSISDSAIEPLRKLNSLSALVLEGTHLSPAAIAKLNTLQNLRELNLDDTRTDDDALTALSQLKSLSTLMVRNANITDRGLGHLGNCKNLTALSLSGTRVSNEGLNSISKLRLYRLDLWDTNATAGGIRALKDCKSITELRISRMKLSNDDLQALAGFKNLQVIELYHIPNLKNDDLNYLTGIKSLTRLYLEDCPLIGDGAAPYIAKMPQLTGLCLNKTDITDQTPARIQNLQNLSSLWIESTNIGDAGMKYLSRLKNLQSLYMSGTLVSDRGIEYLAALPGLKTVDASHCYNISLHGIRSYYKSHPGGTFETHYSD
ncbi:MAG: hypothetical protein EKK48_18190 [Candidatus Melainabacteria bacterium]|nr:MAG: hypothetical protein EKK48_18190 [Candidatus Melainabacteria bacterium]